MGIKIITDSACDLTKEYIESENIGLVSLILNLNGKLIKDDLGKTLTYKEFYTEMRKGATPTTSQINSYDFEEEFIKHIKNGDSIIYISLSSNLSGTFNSANIAKNNLIEEYPDAKIYLVDSLSVSVGQGFLVEKACDMRNNGLNAEEIVNWLEENKRKVVHSILIDDLNHLKRGGRISSTTATIGGLLNIKPTLYIDDDGKLVQGEKIKGKKKALRFLVNEVKERAINTENETLYICHGDCLEEAETLKNMILWIAYYTAISGNAPVPPDVGGWTRWRVWQYSESATVAGVTSKVDANWGPNSIDLLTQPRNVSGLTVSRKGNTLNISWKKNTDTDLVGYNIFANNYWIGTVDAKDTSFSINTNQLPFKVSGPIKISIEAFDNDGETSKRRSSFTI